MADEVRGKSKDTINKIIEKILFLISILKEKKMSLVVRTLSLGWVMIMIMSITNVADGAIPNDIMATINAINNNGPHLGVVVPNRNVMNPLLESSNFLPNETIPHLDYAGRRFRIGTLENRNVIVVMSGRSILNSGIATQLLLSIFKVEGVVHFGLAGSADPDIQIGDVTIPHYWAHTGLWHWERFGDGSESIGDYTKEYGDLKFADYQVQKCTDNLLNRVWYQPEDIYLADREPENRERVFSVPIAKRYFSLAKNLEDIDLEMCVNPTTCLPRTPKAVRVIRGVSANVFVDNVAYREFLRTKFRATPIDMEGAGVALVCRQQRTPFIAIKAISNLPGTTSSHESSTFSSLAVQNAVRVVVKFISLLSEKVITLDEAE